MNAPARLGAALLLAGCVASCAGPSKLTGQSERSLARGETERAYEKAAEALRKDPEYEPARRALRAAATVKAGAGAERIAALAAASDTVAAGRAILDLDAFRAELAGYRVTLAPDSALAGRERTIRRAAARRLVDQADEAERSGRPRVAYDVLAMVRALAPDYPGLDEREEAWYAEAVHRIAILPITNQTGTPGLERELTEAAYREAGDRIRPENFPFTQIIRRDEVRSHVTLEEARDLDKTDAIEIGRRIGADLVVRGRLYALDTDSRSRTWEGSIYRRTAARDSSGGREERYAEIPLTVVSRSRRVSLRFEFEIRETERGSVVARHDAPYHVTARVIDTSYRAEGDCDDFVLIPPAMKRADARGAETRDRAWKESCGSWELPAFLEMARKEGRRSYKPSMRGEFHGDTERRPVVLGDLPPVEELALVALRGAWEPMVDALRRVERQ